LVAKDYPWNPEMFEDRPGRAKLLEFKRTIDAGFVRETFTSPKVRSGTNDRHEATMRVRGLCVVFRRKTGLCFVLYLTIKTKTGREQPGVFAANTTFAFGISETRAT
jgi:hypothetical protein